MATQARSSVAIKSSLRGNEADPDEIFDSIDADGDGRIDKDEFRKMFRVVRSAMKEDHEAVQGAKRRANLFKGFGVLLTCFFIMLLLGNMGLGYIVYKITKDTSITDPAKAGGEFTEHTMTYVGDGGLVRVGESLEEEDLAYENAIAHFDKTKTIVHHGIRATVLGAHLLSEDAVTYHTSMGVFKISSDDTVEFHAADDSIQQLYDSFSAEYFPETAGTSRRSLATKCTCKCPQGTGCWCKLKCRRKSLR